MTDDEIRSFAMAAGLKRMLAEHSQQLKAAMTGAKTVAERLPRDLAPEDEPAHVFRLTQSPKRQP